MDKFDFVILYVDDVARSTAFYKDLLGPKTEMEMPEFTMFATKNGQMLGLQARAMALPAPHLNGAAGGGTELGVQVAADGEVDALHADWAKRGIAIVEAPNRQPYGYTFMATDPDRHRIRVYAPA